MQTSKAQRARERRNVALTMAVSTAAAALVLAGILFAVSSAAKGRLRRIDDALERGDFTAAQAMIAVLRDEDLRGEFEKRETYIRARQALTDGAYQTAEGLFTALGSYEDAPQMAKEAGYQLACGQLEAGETESAGESFSRLGNYRDAPELAKKAVLLRAESYAAEERVYEAFLLLCSLEGYADAEERALDLAEQIVGVRDREKALAAVSGMTEAERSRWDALGRSRRAVPEGIIALGFFHTAALKSDGAVLACGDDSYGQCGVEAWRDVKSVCAGAYHTAALLADGTVAAVGRNEEGQCDVSDWRDIVAVTAADYATFGLRADGTVVYTGYNDYYMLPDWTGITRISAGSYALAGLRADGTALITHRSARSEDLRELADVRVNTGYAAGLRPDGTAVCTCADLSDWTDMIYLSAGASAVLGLDEAGHVRARFFRAGDEMDFSDLSDIAVLAAGGTHYAFVGRDGSVTVMGENSRGQCATEDWDLF